MLRSGRRLFLRFANRILPDKPFTAVEHATYHFDWPSISVPQTFSDFVHHRKLFDRDPRLPVFADKVRVKQEISRILGAEWVNPTIWVGEAAKDVPFDNLPAAFVLKANHGANMNYIARPDVPVNREAVRKLAAHWLGNDFGRLHREWAYSQIPRRLLVEPLLADGEPLVDYKFYVLGGKVCFIDVKQGRGELQVETSAIMDANWRRLPFRYGPQLPHPTNPPAPKSLPQFLAAAEKIGQMFSLVRVDLYEVNGRPYFGETTFYPSAGLASFSHRRFDAHFGSFLPQVAETMRNHEMPQRKIAS